MKATFFRPGKKRGKKRTVPKEWFSDFAYGWFITNTSKRQFEVQGDQITHIAFMLKGLAYEFSVKSTPDMYVEMFDHIAFDLTLHSMGAVYDPRLTPIEIIYH